MRLLFIAHISLYSTHALSLARKKLIVCVSDHISARSNPLRFMRMSLSLESSAN